MAGWPSIIARALALASLAAVVGALSWAPAASAGVLTPEAGGSPNADEIASLYKLALYIAAAVFVAVEVGLVYALIRFRYRRGAVAAQIRGNTSLEISWTVAATLILVVLAVVTFIKLPSIVSPAPPGTEARAGDGRGGGPLYAAVGSPPPEGVKTLRIAVNGQQYLWRYTYPDGVFAYDTMVVPVNTTVTLDIRAQDVIHSWWIPQLGGKFDAVPGYTNRTWFHIPGAGVYEGQCAELCGRNHANMLARVRAVPEQEYRSWLAGQRRAIDAANEAAAERRALRSGGGETGSGGTPAGGGSTGGTPAGAGD